jgi:hypothetical protein
MTFKDEILGALNHCGCDRAYVELKTDSIIHNLKFNIDSILKEEAANYDKGFPVGDFNEGFIVGVRRVKELLK